GQESRHGVSLKWQVRGIRTRFNPAGTRDVSEILSIDARQAERPQAGWPAGVRIVPGRRGQSVLAEIEVHEQRPALGGDGVAARRGEVGLEPLELRQRAEVDLDVVGEGVELAGAELFVDRFELRRRAA